MRRSFKSSSAVIIVVVVNISLPHIVVLVAEWRRFPVKWSRNAIPVVVKS